MPAPFIRIGAQIQRSDGAPFADCANEDSAEKLLLALNVARDWDEEDIVTLVSDAMSDAQDLDVGLTDLARAAVSALKKEGLLP